MKFTIAAWFLGVLVCAPTISAKKLHSTTLRGQVVAFRPAERLTQPVSGVVNQETFLFGADNMANRVVKVVYEHDGYSDISSGEMWLTARRDDSCDNNFANFTSQAPLLTVQGENASAPQVTLLNGFQGMPPSTKLQCYRLERSGIRTTKARH